MQRRPIVPVRLMFIAAFLALALTIIVYLADRENITPAQPIRFEEDAGSRKLSDVRQDNPHSLNLVICFAIENHYLLELELAPEFEGDDKTTVVLQPYFYGILEDGELHLRGFQVEAHNGFFKTIYELYPTPPGLLPEMTIPANRLLNAKSLQTHRFEPNVIHAQKAVEGAVTPFCQIQIRR